MSRRDTEEPRQSGPIPEAIRDLDANGMLELLAALDLSHTCIRDFDGAIRFWCRGNELLYGWSREAAVGRVSYDLLKTRFPKPLGEIEAELLQRGCWAGELRQTTMSGTELWVASDWALRRDSNGRPISVTEVNSDITEFKRAGETSRYLASIVEASDDAIIGKGCDGIVSSWNAGAETLFGYSALEMVGETILKLFPPELVAEELTIQARLQRGERIDHYETVRIAKSGQRIAVSLTVSPIRDEAGKIVGASKIARDISSRKALEEAFRQSEDRQRLATEAGDLGLWSYDRTARNSYWSNRCKTIHGLSPETPVPSYEETLRLIHPADSARVDRTFQAAVAEGKPFDVDFRVVDRNGGIHWVQSKGRPRLDGAGTVTQMHGTVLEFTRRKETEEALRRTNSQLQQFAYAAAHDLQEPLRNVALSISLAKSKVQGELDDETEALFRTASQSAQQMKEMMRDLVAYSNVLGDEWEPDPLTDCDEALASAVDRLAPAVREASAVITHEPLPIVRMPRAHLLQLFQNIIGNALKYRGSDTPKIHISAISKQHSCEIRVEDNGIGVDPRFHDRVFGVFKRLRQKDTPGTGIGLALCKRIVEHYGGEIRIESDGVSGTTLCFTVPAVRKSGDDGTSSTAQPPWKAGT